MNDYEIQKIRDTAFCSGYNTAVSKYERQNGDLTDKVKELEAQIEKMKCCGNCKFGYIACGNYLCELLMNNCNSIPFHCDKWEIKEND